MTNTNVFTPIQIDLSRIVTVNKEELIQQLHRATDLPQITDIAMWQAAKDIRYWLAELSGLIPRLNEGPNPYYGNTMSGLTLIEYYGGPAKIGTPLGEWAMTGGGCLKREWHAEAIERLGLVMLHPEFNDEQGTHGPVWGITKDLNGNPLPQPWTESSANMFGKQKDIFGKDAVPCTVEDLARRVVWSISDPSSEFTPDFLAREFKDALWSIIKDLIDHVNWDDDVHLDFKLKAVYTPDTDLEYQAQVKEAGMEGLLQSWERRLVGMLQEQGRNPRYVLRHTNIWKVTDNVGNLYGVIKMNSSINELWVGLRKGVDPDEFLDLCRLLLAPRNLPDTYTKWGHLEVAE